MMHENQTEMAFALATRLAREQGGKWAVIKVEVLLEVEDKERR